MQFEIINTGTREYDQMIKLRMDVLLNPIGIPVSYINEEKEKEDILLGAYREAELIGCCILTPQSNQQVQLRQMAVQRNFQNTGVGRMIVSQAETIALRKGFRLLFMHARDNVIPFYQKCGYTIVGDVFYEVGIAHHNMEKQLLKYV
jgi:predicted GNAT family N-acyltransferase